MAKADVNFSERTKKRKDPHDWKMVKGDVVMGSRVLFGGAIDVYMCQRCKLSNMIHPKYIHDLPPCEPKE